MTIKQKSEAPAATPPTFGKEKILKIERYRHRADLLAVLLLDGKAYTFDQVDAALDKFLKGKVK